MVGLAGGLGRPTPQISTRAEGCRSSHTNWGASLLQNAWLEMGHKVSQAALVPTSPKSEQSAVDGVMVLSTPQPVPVAAATVNSERLAARSSGRRPAGRTDRRERNIVSPRRGQREPSGEMRATRRYEASFETIKLCGELAFRQTNQRVGGD